MAPDGLLPAAFRWDARTRVLSRAGARLRRARARAQARRRRARGSGAALRRAPERASRAARAAALPDRGARGVASSARGRGVVVLPTGAGKTTSPCWRIDDRRRSTLVVAPTLDLVRQWYDLLRTSFGVEVGVVGGGEHDVQPLTVTTYDSAYLHMEHLGARFGLVVFDECHHLPGGDATRWRRELCLAPFRLGLTATPERADGREAELDALIGPIVYRKDIVELARRLPRRVRDRAHRRRARADERAEYDAERAIYRDFVAQQRHPHGQPDGFGEFIMRAVAQRGGPARDARPTAGSASSRSRAPAKLDYLEHLLARAPRRPRARLHPGQRHRLRGLAPLPDARPSPTRPRCASAARSSRGFRHGRYGAVVTSKVLNEGVDVPDANVAIVISRLRLGARARAAPRAASCGKRTASAPCSTSSSPPAPTRRSPASGGASTMLTAESRADPALWTGTKRERRARARCRSTQAPRARAHELAERATSSSHAAHVGASARRARRGAAATMPVGRAERKLAARPAQARRGRAASSSARARLEPRGAAERACSCARATRGAGSSRRALRPRARSFARWRERRALDADGRARALRRPARAPTLLRSAPSADRRRRSSSATSGLRRRPCCCAPCASIADVACRHAGRATARCSASSSSGACCTASSARPAAATASRSTARSACSNPSPSTASSSRLSLPALEECDELRARSPSVRWGKEREPLALPGSKRRGSGARAGDDAAARRGRGAARGAFAALDSAWQAEPASEHPRSARRRAVRARPRFRHRPSGERGPVRGARLLEPRCGVAARRARRARAAGARCCSRCRAGCA